MLPPCDRRRTGSRVHTGWALARARGSLKGTERCVVRPRALCPPHRLNRCVGIISPVAVRGGMPSPWTVILRRIWGRCQVGTLPVRLSFTQVRSLPNIASAVSAAIQASAALTTSAAHGAVRDVSRVMRR